MWIILVLVGELYSSSVLTLILWWNTFQWRRFYALSCKDLWKPYHPSKKDLWPSKHANFRSSGDNLFRRCFSPAPGLFIKSYIVWKYKKVLYCIVLYIHYRIVKIEGLHKIYMLHYCIFIATICEIMVPFKSTKAPKTQRIDDFGCLRHVQATKLCKSM